MGRAGEGMDYIDSNDYDPDKLYIRERTPDEIKVLSNNPYVAIGLECVTRK